MTNVPLNTFANVTLDTSGNGTVKLSPEIGQRWNILTAAVSTSTSVKIPQANIYIGGAPTPSNLVDGTFTGNLDSTSKTAGFVFSNGQYIWAVWTGGDVGALATLSIIGVMEYGSNR